jgi:fatty acid desaturase
MGRRPGGRTGEDVLQHRDYSLTGCDSQRALQTGLAQAKWYSCPVGRQELKNLMRRRNGPAIRDTLIWLSAMLLCAVLAVHFWGHWAAIPFFFLYGVLYGSASDSRWHECAHGTAFKSDWMNEAVYLIACFMMLREPTVWRWSHARHHTDTLIVGRDPEIEYPRPTVVLRVLLDLFALRHAANTLYKLVLHSAGRLTADDRTLIPQPEHAQVYVAARVGLALLGALVGTCIAVGSVLPALLVGLPTLYGAGFGVFFSTTQHAGLAEDVLDHRLNSRTVHMNGVFRFLYWNMNYHLEHHLFPMVPFHALPRLHQAAKGYLPPPYPSCWAAYREIIPALARQRKDPSWFVLRPLPTPAAAAPREEDAAIALTSRA